jgi:hypothetical protein
MENFLRAESTGGKQKLNDLLVKLKGFYSDTGVQNRPFIVSKTNTFVQWGC